MPISKINKNLTSDIKNFELPEKKATKKKQPTPSRCFSLSNICSMIPCCGSRGKKVEKSPSFLSRASSLIRSIFHRLTCHLFSKKTEEVSKKTDKKTDKKSRSKKRSHEKSSEGKGKGKTTPPGPQIQNPPITDARRADLLDLSSINNVALNQLPQLLNNIINATLDNNPQQVQDFIAAIPFPTARGLLENEDLTVVSANAQSMTTALQVIQSDFDQLTNDQYYFVVNNLPLEEVEKWIQNKGLLNNLKQSTPENRQQHIMRFLATVDHELIKQEQTVIKDHIRNCWIGN